MVETAMDRLKRQSPDTTAENFNGENPNTAVFGEMSGEAQAAFFNKFNTLRTVPPTIEKVELTEPQRPVEVQEDVPLAEEIVEEQYTEQMTDVDTQPEELSTEETNTPEPVVKEKKKSPGRPSKKNISTIDSNPFESIIATLAKMYMNEVASLCPTFGAFSEEQTATIIEYIINKL